MALSLLWFRASGLWLWLVSRTCPWSLLIPPEAAGIDNPSVVSMMASKASETQEGLRYCRNVETRRLFLFCSSKTKALKLLCLLDRRDFWLWMRVAHVPWGRIIWWSGVQRLAHAEVSWVSLVPLKSYASHGPKQLGQNHQPWSLPLSGLEMKSYPQAKESREKHQMFHHLKTLFILACFGQRLQRRASV